MAKFKSLDLILNKGEKAIFGSSNESYFTYTTISGYNTPSGVLSLTPIDELVVNVPIAGERAIEPYHLVRYDQLVSSMSEINPLDWQESVLSFSTAPPGSPAAGDRYVVSASGTSGAFVGHENDVAEYNGTSWVFQDPNEGFTLRDEDRDEFWTFDGSTWGRFAATVDHSELSGLDTDDHEQYILVDGSRGFTNTVSGVYPLADSDLVTKEYVDDIVEGLTGGEGAVVTISGNQTITGDKVFDNNLTTFLGDVFFDGIQITMSGTTLNTQSGATFNYDSTSTITNSGTTTYGDTAVVEYQSGSEVIHETGSSETHESGSTDTYEDGSTLTLSGTNVDVTGDTTINLGDGTTIIHESGSSEVYEGGSETTHESGSNDTYLDGSNLTFSGSNISYEGDTIITVNSGTTTNYEEGSVINNDGDTIYGDTSTVTYSGAEITYEGDTNITVSSGVTTTYEDGSTTINEGDTIYGDTSTTVYEDGSEVTYSGAEITYGGDTNITVESGTTTTYEDGSVTNNYGDTFYGDTSEVTYSGSDITYEGGTTITVESGTTTVYEAGSEVTFSGTTTFETETYFNSDIVMASGTSITIGDLVITGTISGSFTDTNRRYGQEPVINGSTSQAVLFADDFDSADYTLVATLTNQVDSPPSIYSTIQGVKTATGFTTYFSGVIDSSNFVLEWIAFLGQQE